MQTVGLSWQESFETAAVLAGLGGAAHFAPWEKVRFLGALLRETAIIGVLYGLWHVVGTNAAGGVDAAHRRAQHLRNVERWLPLPSEHTMQHLVLGHRLLVETANLYYATMHFTMMLVFLLWLFVRHREHYRPIRRVLAWTTLLCLLVQFIPVAPPRMFPDMVDTAALYGQSVYSGGLAADQLSAMPSVHVAWAVLVGWYVWKVSPSRWRVIGPLHTVVTILVVVVTGNHWWSDGIVATSLLCLSAWWVFGLDTAWAALRARTGRDGGSRDGGSQDGGNQDSGTGGTPGTTRAPTRPSRSISSETSSPGVNHG